MSEKFTPPINERDTDELIYIALSSTKTWKQSAINQANNELKSRGYTQKELNKIDKKWTADYENQLQDEEKQLEFNKTESYTKIEMIKVLIFGTIFFFRPRTSGLKTLSELWEEQSYLKFKQKIIILIIGFSILFVSVKYSMRQSELKLQKEMDEIDITEWEKFHGYD